MTRSARQPGRPRGLLALLLATLLVVAACDGQQVAEPSPQATQQRSRLLTAAQYHNSIADLFGDDIAAGVISPIPPMPRRGGLRAAGAASIGLTSDQLAQIQSAAGSIAEKVVDENHRDFLLPCRPDNPGSAAPDCAGSYLAEVLPLLYRRPVDAAQLAALVAVAGEAATQLEDFYAGLALALETALISPEFLFISDRAEADPAHPGAQRLDAWSLASRLSFLLWNGPPDAPLLQAAQRGDLDTPAGLAGELERMLASPRLERGMRAFFDDMLHFEVFDSLAKDASVYPMVTGTTLEQAREQTLRTVIDHLLTRRGDYRDLMTTRSSFMSPALAVVYGVPAPPGWVAHEFPADGPRRGLLTQVSFLAAHSHAVRSSPTLRGKALREVFLCQSVPPPPPNVDFSALEENEHARTARERLVVHNSNPSCAGCHLIMDPMGLALENFDGAGQYRVTENGAPLDVSGELDGREFDDVRGLSEAMYGHPKLAACLVERLYTYATGGPLDPAADRPALDRLETAFVTAGHRLPPLLRDLALNPSFRRLRAADPAQVSDGPSTAPARISAEMLALRQPTPNRVEEGP
jgi:hypothetical protein